MWRVHNSIKYWFYWRCFIKYTINNNSYKEIEDLNNEEIIKWFLPTYERISKNLYSDKNSIEELVNLLKSIGSNEIKLEYKNENPFLAKWNKI